MKLFIMVLISSGVLCKSDACQEPAELNAQFVATSGIPFNKLMDQSMRIMHRDMGVADPKRTNEHNFLKMMRAHHQGAIDMANALMAHSKDEELKNFAVSIVASQKNEIEYIKVLLKRKYKR